MPKAIRPILLWFIPLAFLAIFYFYPLANILGISLARSEAGELAPFAEAIKSNPFSEC